MERFINIDFKKNSFTVLRYIAAFQVIIGHLTNHFNLNLPSNIIFLFLGVPIFFCLSGFLIAASLDRNNDFKTYLYKRYKRIYPELWVGVAINSLIILALNPSILSHIGFWLFNLTQGTLFQFWTPSILRYYGVGVPNGSLWTISIFVQFYIIIYFIYPKLLKLNFKRQIILLILFMLPNLVFVYLEPYIPQIIYKLFKQTIILYFYIFYIGILIYIYRNKIIPLLIKYFYLLLIIYIIYTFNFKLPSVYIDVIRSLLLCLLTIGFGYKFNKLNLNLDISFGMYIYHMIFINLFIELGFHKNLISSFFVILLSIVCAYFSHKLVYRKKRRKV